MRKARIVLAAVAIAATAACGKDKPILLPPSIAGSYSLRAINGSAVPFTIVDDIMGKAEVTEGVVTLATDKSWTGRVTVRLTVDGRVTTSSATGHGSYREAESGRIDFTETSPPAPTYVTATIADGKITGSVEGFTAVLTR